MKTLTYIRGRLHEWRAAVHARKALFHKEKARKIFRRIGLL